MSAKTITLTQVRQEMRAGHPFSITYRTLDRTRKTGGKRVSMENAMLVMAGEPAPKSISGTGGAGGLAEMKRDPKHFLHGTFNVMQKNTQVTKIHWLLIEEFNKRKVTL